MSGPPPFSAETQFTEAVGICQIKNKEGDRQERKAGSCVIGCFYSCLLPNAHFLRDPADETHLAAGFSSLPAVRKKLVGCAARAGTDLKKLVRRYAGRFEDAAIELAQVHEGFAASDLDIFLSEPAPFFAQRP